jgi:thiamine kinase-like enzyme
MSNPRNKAIVEDLRTFMGDQVLVLSHGDMHLGNMLHKQGDTKGLIDFEFSGYSYPALDIAMLVMSF